MLHGEGISGVVFLALYSCNLALLIFGFSTGRIRFKSVYTFLLIHVILRLAAQSVAIAIGSQRVLDFGLLIAFFVLGAEGYFSLVLCTYRFLIHHHQYAYPVSGSWLEGNRVKREHGKERPPWYKRLKRAMTARDENGKRDPWVMSIIHWVLIAANALIISGGSQVNGSDYGTDNYWSRLSTANACRAAGQAVFLIINLFLANFLILSARQDRNPSGTLPSASWASFFRVSPEHGAADALKRGGAVTPSAAWHDVNPTLRILAIAWPPLIIRGVFGLLQALVPAINYAMPDVYDYVAEVDSIAFKPSFVALETCFAVLPEWIACCLLCTTMLTEEGNRRLRKEKEEKQKDRERADVDVEADQQTVGEHEMGPTTSKT